MKRFCASAVLFAAFWLPGTPVCGQLISYPDPCLDYIYPAGGQVGQQVTVELGGNGGLLNPTGLQIDGPPGVSLVELLPGDPSKLQAVLQIAPDAPPGRRRIRVVGAANGLTNYRYFFVTKLAEPVEAEPNDVVAQAQELVAPCVLNGRLEKPLDEDCYRFTAQAGQSIVAAVIAHRMDSKLRQSFNLGFVDASVEVSDADGRILAAAEDTLGLDPVASFVAPSAGPYFVRVRGLAYKGSPSCVYRLVLGEAPFTLAAYPPGGQRGQTVSIEFSGVNIPPGTRRDVAFAPEGALPWVFAAHDPVWDGVQELPLVVGDFAESLEQEPNDEPPAATPLACPAVLNGRFDQPGDVDWYRLDLNAGQGVILSTVSQRMLGAATDTVVSVYDADGQQLAENDDGAMFAGQCGHDFETSDCWLVFNPPTAGAYFVAVRDQTGAGGPGAVYRLKCQPLEFDFLLYQWPDAVPVWGPGSSASFIVQLFHWGGLTSDVQVAVEGLPDGWTGSVGNFPVQYCAQIQPPYGFQIPLTITAPADAQPGAAVTFRVVGRCQVGERVIEHFAQPLTLYGNSHNDRMFLRASDKSQAALAPPFDCRLSSPVAEITTKIGQACEIPVTIERLGDPSAPLALSLDGPTVSAGCAWRPPLAISPGQASLTIPLTVSAAWPPGTYPLVISRAWAADIRSGRPGPCTRVILLHVEPAE